MAKEKHQCVHCGYEIGGTWTRGKLRCGVMNAKYEHEGKWYCKRHHPPTVEAKRIAENAKWDAKMELRVASEAIAAARVNVIRAAQDWVGVGGTETALRNTVFVLNKAEAKRAELEATNEG